MSSAEFGPLPSQLDKELPRLAVALRRAESNRAASLSALIGGARLRGLEQLMSYLDIAHDRYLANQDLRPAAILVARLIADFETALEATLSGYQGVMSDAMRDVIEIECLMLDFVLDLERLLDWTEASDAERRKRFAPVRVRERLEEEGVTEFSSSALGLDYRAHSQALHVTPRRSPVAPRGLLDPEDAPLWSDAGFWEMFEHGWRALFAVEALRTAGETSDTTPLAPLDDFHDARERTGEMLELAIGLMAAPELEEQLGRKPTTEEIIKKARDILSARPGDRN